MFQGKSTFKTQKEIETFLRFLSCFSDNNEVIHLQSVSAKFGFKRGITRNMLDALTASDIIVPMFTNGEFPRYKMNKTLDCFEFILFPSLLITQKTYLCIILENIRQNNLEITQDLLKPRNLVNLIPELSSSDFYNLNDKLKSRGFNLFDLLTKHSDIVKLNILEHVNHGIIIKDDKFQIDIKEEQGNIKICNNGKEININSDLIEGLDYKKYLDDNDSYVSQVKNKVKYDLPKILINKVKNSLKERSKRPNINHDKLEMNLTEEYLQDLLEEQNYRCYYSNVPIDPFDPLRSPSVDRINSDLGYIQGNVCICTGYINKAKCDLTVDEFKDMIRNIYNNIDNF